MVQVVPGLAARTAPPATTRCRSGPGDLNGRLPTAWQIELIDQVTWCSRATRTSEPQKKAVTAPCQDHVTSPPISGGQQQRDQRPARGTAARSHGRRRSLIRSGAYLLLRRSAPRRTSSRYAPTSSPFISAGTSRRTATASAGRRPRRRTCGACGGRPPSGPAGPPWPASPAIASAILQRPVRLERAVGEVAVEAHRDAVAAECST